MQAATGTLPEDVQRLFQEVEDYLFNSLEKENLSARAREQGEEILSDIEQLKDRYQWELQAGEAENTYSKTTQELGLVLKQGYLEKKSRDPKIFGSEWQKRWCVLDQKAFYYYANEKSKQPKGMFLIENYRARLASYLRKDTRKDCCFEVMCPGKRTYEFTAPSPEDAKDWVDQILFLLKDMRSFVIPCEEEEEEMDKEVYDDIDSFDSPNASLQWKSSLNPEEEESEGESKEGIYEILPDDELALTAPDNTEDAEKFEKTEDSIRNFANYYQGLWDCTSGHPDELSFRRGDLIYILSKDYDTYGWWVGELNRMVGIVPKEYLMPAYDVEDR